jgi:hypothetical protein
VDLSHVDAHAELPMDLILGYTTLRQAHWVFDFPRKRWAISQRVKGSPAKMVLLACFPAKERDCHCLVSTPFLHAIC